MAGAAAVVVVWFRWWRCSAAAGDPRLQGLARGLGGGACVGGAHGSGRCLDALVDESSGAGRWTGDLDPWSLWWTRPPRGSPPSRCLRARIACSGAPSTKSVPRAAAGGPGRSMRRAYRPRDEGRAAEPRPGRHVGEVDHPAPVRAGGGGSRGAAGRRGPGSPWRARWCASSCPARRRSGPVPACAAPAVHRATRGPSRRVPGSRQVFLDPSAASKRLGPPGRGSPLDPGAASEIERADGGLLRAA